jgi:hypothetical protein
MARKQPLDLSYDQATKEHLHAIDAKYHSLIRAVIEEQLSFEPETETRNRKPLRQPAPFEATWELRLGPKSVSGCFTASITSDVKCRFKPSA